jgi:hypothetical protein
MKINQDRRAIPRCWTRRFRKAKAGTTDSGFIARFLFTPLKLAKAGGLSNLKRQMEARSD